MESHKEHWILIHTYYTIDLSYRSTPELYPCFFPGMNPTKLTTFHKEAATLQTSIVAEMKAVNHFLASLLACLVIYQYGGGVMAETEDDCE